MDRDSTRATSTLSIEEALRYAAVFASIAFAVLVIGGGLLVAAIAFVLEEALVVGALVGFLALAVLSLGSIALSYKFVVDAVGRGGDITTESADTGIEPSETRED